MITIRLTKACTLARAPLIKGSCSNIAGPNNVSAIKALHSTLRRVIYVEDLVKQKSLLRHCTVLPTLLSSYLSESKTSSFPPHVLKQRPRAQIMNLRKLKKKVSRALDQLVDVVDVVDVVDAVDPTDHHSHAPNPYSHPSPPSHPPTLPSTPSEPSNFSEWYSERLEALGEEYIRQRSALEAGPMRPHELAGREKQLEEWHHNETMLLHNEIVRNAGTISKQAPAHFGMNPSVDVELYLRDVQRSSVLQTRGLSSEQYMAPFKNSSTETFELYQHIMSKKTGPSIEELEQRQMKLPGPKWYINNVGVEHAFKLEVEDGPIATAMKGLEDGVAFADSNKKRYNEIGPKALQNVCLGLSRVLDVSAGVDEIFRFREEVNTRRKALPDEASIYKVSADEVVKSEYPIYAVSYRHTVFDEHWRMSDEQMKQLFAILSLLTEEGRVRIWCDRLLPPRYTAKWEGVGLVPYTLFPVISLGCQSSFPGEEADDRLWLEVERHMGHVCHGVITIVGKVRSRGSLAKSSMKLACSLQPKLIKAVGDNASVRRALLVFARSMIDGIYSTTTSSTYNLQESMKAVALELLRGWDIERVMGNSDELGDSYDFSRCAESVFQGLKDSAFQFDEYNGPVLSAMNTRLERRASDAKRFWNGTSEFVGDVRMAEGLKIGEMARSYYCTWEDGSEDMVVLGTLHGPVRLFGLMLVKKERDDYLRGKVVSRLANISFGKTFEQLDIAEIKKMARGPSFIFTKNLLEGTGFLFAFGDGGDGTTVEPPNFEKVRHAEASFDEVCWE